MAEKQKFRYENWIEAPRSAEIAIGIRQMAMDAGLDVTINTETSGWIFKRDTVFFRVESSDLEKVERFRISVECALKDYQKQVTRISGYGV